MTESDVSANKQSAPLTLCALMNARVCMYEYVPEQRLAKVADSRRTADRALTKVQGC